MERVFSVLLPSTGQLYLKTEKPYHRLSVDIAGDAFGKGSLSLEYQSYPYTTSPTHGSLALNSIYWGCVFSMNGPRSGLEYLNVNGESLITTEALRPFPFNLSTDEAYKLFLNSLTISDDLIDLGIQNIQAAARGETASVTGYHVLPEDLRDHRACARLIKILGVAKESLPNLRGFELSLLPRSYSPSYIKELTECGQLTALESGTSVRKAKDPFTAFLNGLAETWNWKATELIEAA